MSNRKVVILNTTSTGGDLVRERKDIKLLHITKKTLCPSVSVLIIF